LKSTRTSARLPAMMLSARSLMLFLAIGANGVAGVKVARQ
jgi:hypothetical protein